MRRQPLLEFVHQRAEIAVPSIVINFAEIRQHVVRGGQLGPHERYLFDRCRHSDSKKSLDFPTER